MSFSASYIYKIKDQMSAGLKGIQKNSQTMTAKLQGGLKRASEQTSKLGGKLANLKSGMVAVAGGLVLKSAFGEASKFETAMNRLSIRLDDGADGMEKLRKDAIKMAKDFHYSRSEVAQTQEELARAGFNSAEILKSTSAIMAMAEVEQISFGESAKMTAGIIKGFGLENAEASRVTDILAKSAKFGKTEISAIASSMERISPIAKEAGINIEELAMMQASLSRQGMDAGKASAVLEKSLVELTKGSEKSVKVFRELGIPKNKIYDAQGRLKSLSGVIEQMQEKGATAQHYLEVFGNRGGMAMSILAKTGKADMESLKNSFSASTNENIKNLETLRGGAEYAMKDFGSAIADLQAEIGKHLLPIIVPAVKAVGNFIIKMGEANPAISKIIAVFALLATGITAFAFGLGMLLKAFSGLMTLSSGIVSIFGLLSKSVMFFVKWIPFLAKAFFAFGATIVKSALLATKSLLIMGKAMIIAGGPVVWIIAGVVALGVAIYALVKHWDKVKEAAAVVISYWSEQFTAFKSWISGLWDGIIDGLFQKWKGLIDFVMSGWSKISGIANKIAGVFGFGEIQQGSNVVNSVNKIEPAGLDRAVEQKIEVKSDVGGVLRIEIDDKGKSKIKQNIQNGNLGFQMG